MARPLAFPPVVAVVSSLRTPLLAAAALLLGAVSAQGQPFEGSWLALNGFPAHGYVRALHSPALNPTAAFTLEAWVAISNSVSGEDCRSIAGKNFRDAWWLGQCNVGGQPTLRSYLKGETSLKQGGIIPRGVWTHVAVVFTGSQRRHYINGELAEQFADPGPLTTSTSEVRIGSDVEWQLTPAGSIDEVRLWNVARTTAQIRANINQAITAPQPGLVAVWSLPNLSDVIGSHDLLLQGSGVGALVFPPSPGCLGSTPAAACLEGRFVVTTKWRTNPTPGTPVDGNGTVAGANANSAVFWFFGADNWEVLAKLLNGCGLNNRYWFFSASATNVFYRTEVTDLVAGEPKIYFNYPGPPAPAVTDTGALATCP